MAEESKQSRYYHRQHAAKNELKNSHPQVDAKPKRPRIKARCKESLEDFCRSYFPELFPTRLRSTGTSFCYNVGRFVAALGPLVKVMLDKMYEGPNADRLTGVTMCGVFLVGLLVLPFLPETKGKALPE